MPDESALESGRRLARDLHRLREERGVSLAALHEETKIPRGLVEAFEESALFDHEMFNRVYLRSFARTYAQVVGLDAEQVAQALEAALEGEYAGGLIEEGRGAEEERPSQEQTTEREPESPATAAGTAAEAESGAGEQRTEAGGAEAGREGESPADEPPEESLAVPSGGTSQSEVPESTPSEGAAGAEPKPVTSPPRASPRDDSVRARQGEGGRSRQERKASGGVPPWAYATGALAVLALLVWLLISVLGGDGEQAVAGDAGSVDTTQAAATAADTAEASQPFEPVALSDTMRFRVIAADGPVRELRVRPDTAIRRPYWIEEGGSQTFTARNRIVFSPPTQATNERPLDVMRLELEGMTYPTDQRNAQGEIVITRDRAQSVLDSLARAGG